MSKDTTEHKLSLPQKLAAIRDEIGAIPKTGQNNFHKYKFAEWGAVQEAVNPLLEKYNILIIPAVTDKRNTFAEGKVFVEVKLKYTIYDLESDSKMELDWWGDGVDNGDKGLYKAYSGCGKYFLVKLFGLYTEDDPENDKAEYKETQKAERTKGQKATTASPAGHELQCPQCGQLCKFHHADEEYGEVFECVNNKCSKKGQRYKFSAGGEDR